MVIPSTVNCKLLFEIVKREEMVSCIEILVVLAVGTLNLTIMPRRIRTDQLVAEAHHGGSFLKESRLVAVGGETVGELGAIVGLYTFNGEAVFFEERRGVLQKSRRAEGTQLLKGFQITKSGKLVKSGILIIFLSACLTDQTSSRNVFHVDLYTLAGILHLLVRLWDILRVRRLNRHLPVAAQYTVYAGDASLVTALHKFHPKHDQSRVRVSPSHICKQLQFFRCVLVRMAMGAMRSVRQ